MAGAALPAELAARLAAVRSAGVITGAGVSAESGIPTYRGRGGLYDDPVAGERTVEALSGQSLRRDPDRTWRAVAALAREALDAAPNAAHRAAVEMEARLRRFVLLTQNVDGLHQEAGSRNVIPIHGCLDAVSCLECAYEGRLSRHEIAALEGAPSCPCCGGVLRPGAVLFGEMLPPAEVQRLHQEFHERPPELVVVAGTTALFPYVAEPVQRAAALGRLTVEVNPESTLLSDVVDWSFRGPAGTWLPRIAAALGRGRGRAGSP